MISLGAYEYNPADILGNGAFAIVYRGRIKSNPEEPVAIKIMLKDQNVLKSKTLLSKEICVLKDLTHENIVHLYDYNISSTGVYLVMEYCNGGDLSEYLQAKRTLPEDTIRHFLIQIGSAMDAMNRKGFMHRDLKPGNILLSHCRDCDQAVTDIPGHLLSFKLADFGFARFLQDGMMAVTMCGSPMYMAPEVLMCRKYDAVADIWSMGIIVYQCLTGKAPFYATTPEALKNIYEKTACLRPKIPVTTTKPLQDLLLKMLIRKPSDRIDFQSFLNHRFLQQKHFESRAGSHENSVGRPNVAPSLPIRNRSSLRGSIPMSVGNAAGLGSYFISGRDPNQTRDQTKQSNNNNNTTTNNNNNKELSYTGGTLPTASVATTLPNSSSNNNNNKYNIDQQLSKRKWPNHPQQQQPIWSFMTNQNSSLNKPQTVPGSEGRQSSKVLSTLLANHYQHHQNHHPSHQQTHPSSQNLTIHNQLSLDNEDISEDMTKTTVDEYFEDELETSTSSNPSSFPCFDGRQVSKMDSPQNQQTNFYGNNLNNNTGFYRTQNPSHASTGNPKQPAYNLYPELSNHLPSSAITNSPDQKQKMHHTKPQGRVYTRLDHCGRPIGLDSKYSDANLDDLDYVIVDADGYGVESTRTDQDYQSRQTMNKPGYCDTQNNTRMGQLAPDLNYATRPNQLVADPKNLISNVSTPSKTVPNSDRDSPRLQAYPYGMNVNQNNRVAKRMANDGLSNLAKSPTNTTAAMTAMSQANNQVSPNSQPVHLNQEQKSYALPGEYVLAYDHEHPNNRPRSGFGLIDYGRELEVNSVGLYEIDEACDEIHMEEIRKVTMVLDLCELLNELAERRACVLNDCMPTLVTSTTKQVAQANNTNVDSCTNSDGHPLENSEDIVDHEARSNDLNKNLTGTRHNGGIVDDNNNNNNSSNKQSTALKFISEAQRIVEQIVLYRRVLYYLEYVFVQVKKAFKNGRLKSTPTSRRRIADCNNLYHRCYIRLRQLTKQSQREDLIEPVGRLLANLTANRLIFQYALEQCYAAEMDEYIGEIALSLRRYKAGITLIHGLCQHAKSDRDKNLLADCMRLLRERYSCLYAIASRPHMIQNNNNNNNRNGNQERQNSGSSSLTSNGISGGGGGGARPTQNQTQFYVDQPSDLKSSGSPLQNPDSSNLT